MSNEILAGINEIAGVIGSAIFDSEDNCIAALCPPPFEPILLTQVMAELRAALNYLNYLDDASPWDLFTVGYDNGYVVLRKVEDLSILALASQNLNSAMLGIGFNVAALKLQKRPASAMGPVSSSSAVRSG